MFNKPWIIDSDYTTILSDEGYVVCKCSEPDSETGYIDAAVAEYIVALHNKNIRKHPQADEVMFHEVLDTYNLDKEEINHVKSTH